MKGSAMRKIHLLMISLWRSIVSWSTLYSGRRSYITLTSTLPTMRSWLLIGATCCQFGSTSLQSRQGIVSNFGQQFATHRSTSTTLFFTLERMEPQMLGMARRLSTNWCRDCNIKVTQYAVTTFSQIRPYLTVYWSLESLRRGQSKASELAFQPT